MLSNLISSHTAIQKFEVKIFLNKLILLFSNDVLYWPKCTVKSYIVKKKKKKKSNKCWSFEIFIKKSITVSMIILHDSNKKYLLSTRLAY